MHVLLLREEDAGADDAYAAALQARGLSCACVRVLAAHTFGVPALAAALRSGPLPSCLVLTSRRAAAALAAALDSLAAPEHAALAAQLRALPALCVGARTASGLAAAAAPAAAAAYAGSAAALLPLVLEAARAGAPGPALFVCGERRLDTLPAGLAAAGIAVLEVPVYRVQAAPAEEVRAAWAAGAAGAPAPAAGAAAPPLAAVLFSPSGVEAAQAAGVLRAAAHLVAIGPTTAAALGAAGLRCAAVAPTPTAQGVLQALLSLAP